MNAFDKNLKRLRKERNLKQEDLAQRLHVTRQTVSGWETGRRQPDLDTLKELADALDADVQELIYGTKPETYPRFQRKYVIYTALSGGIAAVLLLFRLLILPSLKVMINTFHWGSLLMFCCCFLPQVEAFAFGSFFPGLMQLRSPVIIKKQIRLCCLAVGLGAMVPPILFWLGIQPWSRWILTNIGWAVLIHILPVLSGIGIMLGVFSNTPEQP